MLLDAFEDDDGTWRCPPLEDQLDHACATRDVEKLESFGHGGLGSPHKKSQGWTTMHDTIVSMDYDELERMVEKLFLDAFGSGS